jgi:predicted MFS family arabinose efflux permease
VLFALSAYLYLFPDMRFVGFCVFGGVWGVVRAFETPAASSVAKLVCKSENLTRAVRIYSLAQSVSRASGPLLCGLLSVNFGYRAAFLANALTYIPSFILLCTVKPKEPEKSDVKEKPIINKPLFASVFVLSFCGISYNLVFGGVIERLGISRQWLAWFMAAVGVGATLAALVKKRTVYMGFGIPVCLALLIFTKSAWWVVLVAVLYGGCDYLFFSFALAKINTDNKDSSLKRAMGIYTALSTGALPLGYLVFGFVNQGFGIVPVLFLSAALTGAAAVLFFGKIR